MGFQSDSALKEFIYKEGDAGHTGLISGLRRSPGGGHGNALQYSRLENSLDRGAWQAEVYGVAELDTTEATKHRVQSRQSTTT